MPLSVPDPLLALTVFLVGVGIVIGSAEVFVESVSESALSLGISAFFLTVVFAGTDLENAILGLAAVANDLPALALGTVFGEGLFILGVGVGIAGLVTPFETSAPRPYLLIAGLSPALLLVLAADGVLTRLDGVLLTFAFLPLLGAVFVLERNAETRYLSSSELEEVLEEDEDDDDELLDTDRGWLQLLIVLVAVGGMTAGSELAVRGARDLLVVFGLSGLAFGATIMSFVASIEELFLTVEPARQGRPHLGVGNVVGSILFFVTANAGVIALVAPIDTSGTVVTVHWPFFLATLLMVLGILERGRVGRSEGTLLLGMYVAYWAVVLIQ